jgi:hypothetical protein
MSHESSHVIVPTTGGVVNVSFGVQTQDKFPREDVRFFARNMELELKVNDHKGHWGNSSVESLLDRIQDELNELREAVALNQSPSAVLSEAADTANFCMMAADNYARNYKP